jgi:hypothetical protein
MIAAFVLLMVAVPYVTTRLGSTIEGWPVFQFEWRWATETVAAAAVATLGAVGGIFSGLISTRDSRATLVEYRTSMIKLALKPLVGAVAAVTLYLLLSWQILTGVQVTNGGTFLLVGFLAGFSERYFLRLLTAPGGDRTQSVGLSMPGDTARETSTAVAPMPASSAPPPIAGTGKGATHKATKVTKTNRSLGET